MYVTANFKETQLTHMRPGQPATITVDAYPGVVFQGHVDSIQAGTGPTFSLFPPENATGNFVKVVQRVPVKIVFDERPDSQHRLLLGMSVEATVQIRPKDDGGRKAAGG
jgi:membrane fusion protein (multidrug efflux system)